MVEYEVMGSSDDLIKVCSLICWDEEYNRIIILKVKGMTGKDGEVLIGQKILVGTSNKEIIPEDISIGSRVGI